MATLLRNTIRITEVLEVFHEVQDRCRLNWDGYVRFRLCRHWLCRLGDVLRHCLVVFGWDIHHSINPILNGLLEAIFSWADHPKPFFALTSLCPTTIVVFFRPIYCFRWRRIRLAAVVVLWRSWKLRLNFATFSVIGTALCAAPTSQVFLIFSCVMGLSCLTVFGVWVSFRVWRWPQRWEHVFVAVVGIGRRFTSGFAAVRPNNRTIFSFILYTGIGFALSHEIQTWFGTYEPVKVKWKN